MACRDRRAVRRLYRHVLAAVRYPRRFGRRIKSRAPLARLEQKAGRQHARIERQVAMRQDRALPVDGETVHERLARQMECVDARLSAERGFPGQFARTERVACQIKRHAAAQATGYAEFQDTRMQAFKRKARTTPGTLGLRTADHGGQLPQGLVDLELDEG